MNPCPGPQCTATIPSDLLACRKHWFQVPEGLRREVNRTWRARLAALDRNPDGYEAAAERHELAKAAAIAEMTL